MANLPEQAHNRTGSAVAVREQDDPYALDQSMVILPTMYVAQYQSEAFKKRRVDYGAIFVAVGSEDAAPVVVGAAGEPISEPVVFYVHRIQTGFDTAEDPNDPKRKRLGRLGGTFAEALARVNGDPTKVWQKFGYTVTVPGYPLLPVRLFASGMAARSGRWLNTQIGLLRQQNIHPLTQAFAMTARPTKGSEGDYALAEFSLGQVKAKEAEKHQEIVQAHADLLASGSVSDEYAEAEVVSDAVDAPSLD